MQKLLHRWVAVLLVPALIADPTLASVSHHSVPFPYTVGATSFAEQALSPQDLDTRQPFLEKTPRLGWIRQAGSLLKMALLLGGAPTVFAAFPAAESNTKPILQFHFDLESTPVNPWEWNSINRLSQLYRLTITSRDHPVGELDFHYDAMGQLDRITANRYGSETDFVIENKPILLGDGRTLHVSYHPGAAPRVWIESPNQTPWLFSGYDLVENVFDGTGKISRSEMSYITISHFEKPDGTILPALESFDHDDMVPFLERVGLSGKQVSVINVDHHPDDAPSDRGPLDIGNWCSYAKVRGLATEILWLRPLKGMAPWSKDVIDAVTPDPYRLKPNRPWVVLTYDADYFSEAVSSRESWEIQLLTTSVVDRFSQRDIQRKIRAVQFTRSAYSRYVGRDYSPRLQSTFILNALISKQQPWLGTAVLRRISRSKLTILPEDLWKGIQRQRNFISESPWWLAALPSGRQTPGKRDDQDVFLKADNPEAGKEYLQMTLPDAGLSPLDHYQDLHVIAGDDRTLLYAGRDPDSNQRVIIKTAAAGSELHVWGNISQEISILKKLNLSKTAAPYVPRLLKDGRWPDGRPYAVLDYFDGITLFEYIQQPGTEGWNDQNRTIVAAILDAVQSIHQSGVAHGGLKPENILLSVGPHGAVSVRIIDFEGAFELKKDGPRTIPFSLFFTAPEISQHRQALADIQSDIYSLGALLYVILTGEMIHTWALGFKFIPTRVRESKLTKGMKRVLFKATSAMPADRYLQVADFRNALDKVPTQPTVIPAAPAPDAVDRTSAVTGDGSTQVAALAAGLLLCMIPGLPIWVASIFLGAGITFTAQAMWRLTRYFHQTRLSGQPDTLRAA